MIDSTSIDAWAHSEFGCARLGDIRRTRRLVAMAVEAASAPSGRMTQVFQTSASLEAAGRFIRSDDVNDEALRASVRRATAQRCNGHPFVWVPVDQTALTLADPQGKKDIG